MPTTHLKLHRDETDQPLDTEPETYPFPAAATPSGPRVRRDRLVAGTVDRAPTEGSEAPALRFAGRVMRTSNLLSDIESTLERMQDRLDRFREHLDESMKFPTPPTDDPTWPPAA